jgi:hypothetical protein
MYSLDGGQELLSDLATSTLSHYLNFGTIARGFGTIGTTSILARQPKNVLPLWIEWRWTRMNKSIIVFLYFPTSHF